MATSNKIVTENQLPGDPNWNISAPDSSIEGFTTAISTNVGGTVSFKINTDASDYTVEIYRLGYYGGDGARLVTTIEHQAAAATNQPAPHTDPSTGLVDAGNWSVTDNWDVPSDAVSGLYMAKLVKQDGSTGGSGENEIPFVIRDDGSQSDIVLQTSDATWQAYNPWGGKDIYDGTTTAVSYNRPITTPWDIISETLTNGAWTSWVDAEVPAIYWLEQNGYDVSYITGVDTASNGSLLLNHKVFLDVGHDEYWSAEQRANIQAAVDSGVNAEFWAGNESYWKTQWQPSIDGSNTDYRTIVTYKETEFGRTNPSGVWTGTWADPNQPGGAHPQNALIGTQFAVGGQLSTIQVAYAFSQFQFWRNTSVANLQPGQTATLVPDILGPEWNVDLDNGFRPSSLIDLSSTTYQTNVLTDFSTGSESPGTATHSLTLYRAPSGAMVFSAGSIFWSWALSSEHGAGPSGEVSQAVDPNVQQAMVNLFADMGVQPGSLQKNLVAVTQSTDNAPPSVNISEIDVQTMGSNTTISATGSALDAGGGVVAGVNISLDGGTSWHPSSGTNSWSFSSWSYANATPQSFNFEAMAIDDSVNASMPEVVPSVVVAQAVSDSSGGGISLAKAVSQVDTLNTQPWSIVWNNYDTSSNWDLQTIAYDDGTSVVAFLDPLNNQPWSLVWNTYDLTGNWNTQAISYKDGTSALAYLDPLNEQDWSLVWNSYDAGGNWDTQTISLDDGTSALAYLDPQGNQSWSVVWNKYDAGGNWDTQTIIFDDDTSTLAYLDPQNIQPWSQVLNTYDAAGNWLSQSISFDDGTHSMAQLDPLNLQPWASDNYVYGSDNSLISHYQVLDNGNTQTIV